MLDAIVLGHQAIGEADRVVRLLVAGRGRVDAVARGARGSRRRFGGALEAGTRLRVTLRTGRGELPWLEEVEVRRAPSRARATLGRLALLAWACEVAAALCERELDAGRLPELLERWLDLLEAEPEPGLASRLAFEVKALTVVGLRPALVRCAACGRALGDPCVFSNAAGGGVHAGCGHGHPVGAADLALVEALLYTRLDETAGRAAPAALAPVLAGFLEHQVGRALRARELLAEEGR